MSTDAVKNHEEATGSVVVEPRTQAWLDDLAAASAGSPPLHELSPQDARQVLRDVQASVQAGRVPADVDDRVVKGGPTGEVNIRVVRPLNGGATLPIIIHCHGGGWILGDRDTHDRLTRELATVAGAVVVFVDYVPAPEARYPLQNEQAYAVLEWAANHGGEVGGDPRRIALFGDSAGGNMAAALTLMSKARGGPAIAGQVLFYPVTDANFHTASYERYADGPWLTCASMRWFWDAYLPDEATRGEPTASPLRASAAELSGLPPALVVNGEHDVLRDEGEAYARKLSQAGVPVTQVRYGGTIHDFVLLNPITQTPAPRAGMAQAGEFLRRALGR
ncbi:alpha/beta hydrolase [Planosporangium flavigriseum]|uniref:Esterase n=1 Tax=Planosporangium flavigriseum TaxID=373681 RepID=A0A8J3PL15_9ACTN|nr:alpha/beta hydrolase [Planosporangium flavigriseum]NJC66526.1 alpha/beta hydrolase [Planosporangium flavigriseum]GIG73397.1 esterase [Planosporangium flavigriseum]